MDKFKQQILISGAWSNDPNIISRKLNINKITLGIGRIEEKDNPGTYLLVPAWDFYGGITNKLSDGRTEEQFGIDKCILSLNAVDGSVIG